MSLDTPQSSVDPDAVARAESLRTRYHAHPETRNYSTDVQLDGESFRLKRPSGTSRPTPPAPQTGDRFDPVDSDAEVDMVVRKASSQHPKAIAESVRTDSSQSLNPSSQATIHALVYGQGRARSKTISSIPQSPSSFVKLTQDKLLRMESDSSLPISGMASSSVLSSHHNVSNLTPSPSITPSRHSLRYPSVSQLHSDPIPEQLTTSQVPSSVGRVQSAPARREEPAEQRIRPDTKRSQSDMVIRSSPTKVGSGRPSDVRKRIEELEEKMRGGNRVN